MSITINGVNGLLLPRNDSLFILMRHVIVSLFCKDSERYFDDLLDVNILHPMLSRISDFLLRDNRGKIRFRDELLTLDYDRVSSQQNILRCLAWLERSHLISPCGKYTDLDVISSDERARFYFEDVGITYHMFNQAKAIARTNKVGRFAENFVFRCILEQKTFRGQKPYFATFGDLELVFFDFVVGDKKTYKVAVEVKASSDKGRSATALLKNGKLDYLIYAKGDSYGGRADNIITIPIYLFGRFHVSEIIAPLEGGSVSDMLKD